MVTEFHNEEGAYQSFVAAAPTFVCNNLGTGAQYHRLHRSDCNILNRAGPAKTGMHTSVRKACSHDLDDLVSDLTRQFGPEGTGFSYCRFCFKQ